MVTASALIPNLAKLLTRQDAEKAINDALDESAKVTKLRLKRHLREWKHQPVFTTETPEPFTREVATDDDIFLFQDAGTDGPYPIRATNKPYLHFKGKKGWARVKEVQHPGLKARNFTKQTAATMQQSDMPRIFRRHIRRGQTS